MRLRLTIAHALDRWHPRAKRLAEKLGWPQAWLQELQAYLKQPRMTPEEFWVRYTLKRMAAEPKLLPTMTEKQALRFYRTSDYMMWRNLVHRRHSTWYRVLETMRGKHGTMLEFGCGIAPVSSWVKCRRPQWVYQIDDISDSAHFQYALWRVWHPRKPIPGPLHYDVITALDVFEHLADPLKHAKQLVAWLKPGGYLHANFVGNELRNDLDLATEEQRVATLAYLRSELELVWERVGYQVYRKAKEWEEGS